MAEYIKRESAIDAVLDVFYDTTDIDLSGEKLEAAILNVRAADVEPVRRGRWVQHPLNGTHIWRCSKCEIIGSPQWNYCPKCGAKMYEEVENAQE